MRELCVHPAALPVLLPHLFWPLLSSIAHSSIFPQSTAFWRETDRFICTGNVGIKLITRVGKARVESRISPEYTAGCVPGQISACDKNVKAQQQSPDAAWGVMQWNAPSAPPPDLQTSARRCKLWASEAKQKGLPKAETPLKCSVSRVQYLGWIQSRSLSV